MHERVQEIDLAGRRVVVEAVVPGRTWDAVRSTDAAVELGDDVGAGITVFRSELSRCEVFSCQCIREGDAVPSVLLRRVRKVGENLDGTGLRKHLSGTLSRREGAERAHHIHRHFALQDRSPEFECALIGGQSLLADGRTGIAADGCGRCRIVEAYARRIDVDELEISRNGRDADRQSQQHGGEAGAERECSHVISPSLPVPRARHARPARHPASTAL